MQTLLADFTVMENNGAVGALENGARRWADRLRTRISDGLCGLIRNEIRIRVIIFRTHSGAGKAKVKS